MNWGNLIEDREYEDSLANRLFNWAKHNFKNDMTSEIKLIITIIIQAAKDFDLDFIYGERCEYYCNLITLDYDAVVEQIERIWNE